MSEGRSNRFKFLDNGRPFRWQAIKNQRLKNLLGGLNLVAVLVLVFDSNDRFPLMCLLHISALEPGIGA